MNKFWNQTLEIKSLIISTTVTILGFLGTLFLFWFNRYDIPLGVLLGGFIISLTWFLLYLSKRKANKNVQLDIALIYIRLSLIVVLAILFTALELGLNIVIISPIFLVFSYLVISLFTLIAYYKKGEDDV